MKPEKYFRYFQFLRLAGLAVILSVVQTAYADSFIATDPMNTLHFGNTATLLPNGRVLVAGGIMGNPEPSAELFNPDLGTWTLTGATKIRRLYPTVTLLPDGKVLLIGGSNTIPPTNRAELYDPVTELWTLNAVTNITRQPHTATSLFNGKVLLVGPDNGSVAELYDLATGTWTLTGALNTTRYGHTATLLPDGKVLVAGGYGTNNSTPYLSSAELYDTVSGLWALTGPMTTARYYHTATLLPNGRVLVAGGSNDAGGTNSAELYDPATGTWTLTGAMNTARYWHTATLLPNGKVLVAGPDSGSGAELYDPATGTWTLTGPLSSAMSRFTATLLTNGAVLLAGGHTTSTALYYPVTPAIAKQPLSQSVQATTTARFNVAAAGPQLSFVWRKDGVELADIGNISGVQTSTLTLSNVLGADAGGYSVVVSNFEGSVTSVVAQLSVTGAGIYVVTHTSDSHLPTPGSLRQAILDAAAGGGGSIVFSNVVGTIVLWEPLPTITNNDHILGPGADVLSISGSNMWRVITLTTGANCTISGLTIRDGYAPGGFGGGGVLNLGGSLFLADCAITNNAAYGASGTDGLGGGISTIGGTLTCSNCTILANRAVGGFSGDGVGGGIYQSGGILNLIDTSFKSNSALGERGYPYYLRAKGKGGAIYNNAAAYLTNCTLSGNLSVGGGAYSFDYYTPSQPAYGGAIYNMGSMWAVSCNFSDNRANGGGSDICFNCGGYVQASGNGIGGAICNINMLVLVGCQLSGNIAQGGTGSSGSPTASSVTQAAGQGGAIFNSGSCLITNGSIWYNYARGGDGIDTTGIPGATFSGDAGEGDGGGIYNSGTLSIFNATVIINRAFGGHDVHGTAAGLGAAIYNTNGAAQIDHSTLSANQATTLGGIYNKGSLWLKNSILADWGGNYSGSVVDAGYNVSSDTSCLLTNVGSRMGINPQLGQFGDNGGPTPTVALLPGSPAIDQGTADGVFTDQRGQQRPFDVTGISNAADGSDIGAFEFVPVPVLTWGLDWINGASLGQVRSDVVFNSAHPIAIAAGVYHSLVLRSDGTVVGWGEDDFGQTETPAGLSNVTAIAAGWGTSLALKRDGTLAEWGWDGGYGLKSTAESLTNITAISACWDCLMALKSDGTVLVWGKSTHGETNLPSGLTGITAIAGGGFHCLALKSDGTIAAWGDNSEGQLNVPAGLCGVVGIAAGGYHSLALRQDGTVVVWGKNSTGQTNVPPNLGEVVAISGGYYHSLALKSDGSIAAWGDNSNGQTNVPANLTNVVAIAAGGYHNLALTGSRAPWTKFKNMSCTTNGQVRFTVSGLCGDVYQILGSTNLLQWQVLGTITNVSGAVDFIDPSATNYSQRFYRILMP